ncbi:hypothetical protein [Leadbetterella sp. DM7]|uniref:hypothetical protein n=1 Tax=Leadbetterella sp. DM7 TaxID=3235085 RepID=UPI00349ED446
MNHINRIISSVRFQLHVSAWIRCLLAGVSAGLVVQALGQRPALSLLAALTGFLAGAFFLKPVENKRPLALRILHDRVEDAEYSLELLNVARPNGAEQLQLERLGRQMEHRKAPQVWYDGVWPFVPALLLAWGVYAFFPGWKNKPVASSVQPAGKEETERISPPVPGFRNAEVRITPPAYTLLPEKSSRDLNISSVAGTVLRWRVGFSGSDNLKVTLNNSRGEELAFTRKDAFFEYTDRLSASGLYAIRAYWKDSLVYQSDYYRLEALIDAAPRIEPASRELYRFHFLKDPESLPVAARISDDFLVKQVYMVATVARGSGENVKFREVRLPVSQTAFKSRNVSATIDLKALNFAPGDELYYYWAAVDNKTPEPNFSKSDTYFLVYKDTAALNESELATMAVNILPEYFRSQRQIIIDTEKLIAMRNKMEKTRFNAVSNDIGFDQKALRIRYGQYLGEEYETSIGDHGHTDSDNPLEGFIHKHDSEEEEHHDHDHDHGHDHGKPASPALEGSKDPLAELLEAYVHSHDDAETNTFYEQSTRSILKTALENMWQSELHLRLYEPEKALPYENKALELLKEVQQKARVFIAKTSYDPPPIKEKELRMKGELKKFNRGFRSEVQLSREQVSRLAGQVAGFLESDDALSAVQKQDVALLSRQISAAVVNAGLDKWKLLTLLQKLLNDQALTAQEKAILKTGLFTISAVQKSALPPAGFGEKQLEKLFWKNLL